MCTAVEYDAILSGGRPKKKNNEPQAREKVQFSMRGHRPYIERPGRFPTSNHIATGYDNCSVVLLRRRMRLVGSAHVDLHGDLHGDSK